MIGLFVMLEFLGQARQISHSSSASRDTGVLGLQVEPHRVLSAGGDVGLISFPVRALIVRLGGFGMLELESQGRTDEVVPFPQADIRYWRGLYGYSISAAVPGVTTIEGTITFRHESEHYTGDNDGGSATDFSSVPHIGDFVMVDVAARRSFGGDRWEWTARAQDKLFLPQRSGYSNGPGADLILRWRRWSRAHPFSSTFAEYLFGTMGFPDAYLFRNLTGVVLPSPHGDVYLYLSADVGHRKGLAVFSEEATIGGGLRFAFY